MISQKKFHVVKKIIERIIQMDNIEEFKEEFIILDESYLDEMAELYKNAFAGKPWNDDWSARKPI